MRKLIFLFISMGIIFNIPDTRAQTNETPIDNYVWKRNKSEAEPGFVVLKSGKKLEGTISLTGSPAAVEAVVFEGDGKKIEFPLAALSAYGLLRRNSPKAPGKTITTSGEAINESPESMYEWRDMGIVMNKVVTSSEPRPGYVILKDGTRLEGEFRLRRKDGVLSNYIIKGDKKYSGNISEVARYGYTVSESAVRQENLEALADDYYDGTLYLPTGTLTGELAKVIALDNFYAERVLLRDKNGKIQEFTPGDGISFTQTIDGVVTTFISYQDTFVEEEFNGETFHVFRNPYPTSFNKFLGALFAQTTSIASTVIASEMAKKDAEKNNYESNMDSIIATSSPEELREIRDGLVRVAGYDSAQDLVENSDNEPLKKNVMALEVALAGQQMSAARAEGPLNREWVILNKKTGEEISVFRADYKKLMEPLLLGCYEYLAMERSEQREHGRWSNFQETLKMLDACY